MTGQIFISYRREDTEGHTGRLHARLHARFPQKAILMDVDGLEPGVDFAKAIQESLASCDVLVAVIGRRWLTASEGSRRRLDDPQDYVRLEIGTALKRGIRVIPVLAEGALMPQPGQLPEDLRPLTQWDALHVNHERFRADADRLVDAVERALESARVERQGEEMGGRRPAAGPRGREGNEPRGLKRHPRKEAAGTGSRAPPADWTAPKAAVAKLKRPWRLLAVMGLGAALCFLGFGLGLFKPTRPPPVSIANPSSPAAPAPVAAASNSPGPVPLVSPASLSLTPSEVEGFAETKRYLGAKDYAKALPLLHQAIEAGNAEAMNVLGELYSFGRGVTQDSTEARRRYQKAAEAGSAQAMSNLGGLYQNGFGVARDYAQARRWYQKAAAAGEAEAKEALSQLQ